MLTRSMGFRVFSHVSRQRVRSRGASLLSVGSRWPRFPVSCSSMKVLRLPTLRPFGLLVSSASTMRACSVCAAARAVPPVASVIEMTFIAKVERIHNNKPHLGEMTGRMPMKWLVLLMTTTLLVGCELAMNSSPEIDCSVDVEESVKQSLDLMGLQKWQDEYCESDSVPNKIDDIDSPTTRANDNNETDG